MCHTKKNENHESVKEQRFNFGLKELTVGVSWIYAVCALTILPVVRARIAWIAVIATIILILFMKIIGDNIANSYDSKYFGYVPKTFIIGVAFKY